MVDYCIDTSIIVEFLRGNEAIENKINTIIYNGLNIFTTYITLCELYKGAFLHSKKEDKIKDLNVFIQNSSIINFTITSCQIFGELYFNLSKKGKIIPESDLMIASIARANNLILITRDKRHFENLGIKVEQW